MYEIKAEDTFIQDVNRWSKKVPELWDEIQAIPEEYDPHLLTNEELNYVGYFEFHLFEGKLDLLVIHTKNRNKKVFRLVRLGSHNELFHSDLR